MRDERYSDLRDERDAPAVREHYSRPERIPVRTDSPRDVERRRAAILADWRRGERLALAVAVPVAFTLGAYAPLWDAMPWAAK